MQVDATDMTNVDTILYVIISGGWGSLALGPYLKLCLFIVFGDVSGIWGRILVCLSLCCLVYLVCQVYISIGIRYV